MLYCSRWSWTSPVSDQVQGRTSTGAPSKDVECVVMPTEPQCWKASGGLQASSTAAAAQAGLYDEHEVKDELVLGPERLQPQDIAFTLAGASHRAEAPVKQELVPSGAEVAGTMGSASTTQNVDLRSCLEQLVLSTCYIRLERTPVSNELHAPQIPLQSFDQASNISDRNKHTEIETQVNSKTKSYICNYCGKLFTQRSYLIKHISSHNKQNSDILNRMNSERFTAEQKLMKRQVSSLQGEEGHCSVKICREQVALRTCSVRLERVLFDKHQHKPPRRDNGYVSVNSAVDKKITREEFYCAICNKCFSSNSYLKKHISKHLWEEHFICDICKKKFCHKCNLISHIKQVHADQKKRESKKGYACKFCKKVLTSKCGLIIHERIHTGEKPFCCNVCMKGFREKNGLTIHMRVHTGEKPFTCQYCMKRFAERGHMVKHRRSHTEEKQHFRNICQICQKWVVSLRAHMLIHSGKKSYVCEVCGKAFRQRATLYNHSRIHKKGEFYACEICRRQFQSRTTLDHHKRSCKFFTCDICEKQFRRRTCLRDHQRVHTGEKPYVCKICQKSCTSNSALSQHKRRHSKNPFTCDICKKLFKTKHMISSHIHKTHTGEKLAPVM